jgi:hypothetical protein
VSSLSTHCAERLQAWDVKELTDAVRSRQEELDKATRTTGYARRQVSASVATGAQLEDATRHFGVLVPNIRDTLPALNALTGKLLCRPAHATARICYLLACCEAALDMYCSGCKPIAQA